MASGGEIKRLRDQDRKSAAVVASYIGVDAEKMRKWESKNVDPVDSEDISKIENYFGVRLHELENLESFQFVKKNTDQNKSDYQDKYITLLEHNNRLLSDKIDKMEDVISHVKANIDKLLEVKEMTIKNMENLETLTKNHLTSHAMNEAYHEQLIELILQTGKKPFSPHEKDRLVHAVHTKGFDKMLVFSKTDTL